MLERTTLRITVAALVVVTAGCAGTGGEPTSTTATPTTAAAGTTDSGPTTAPAPSTPAPTSEAASAGVIPAACATGFTDYLIQVEPVVAAFDPATAVFGEYFAFDQARREVGMELLSANDSRATYSCPQVGLEFSYFDADTPWEAVLVIARAEAPGTVAYLETTRVFTTAAEVGVLADYGVADCDAAVTIIKDTVAAQMAAGTDSVASMALDDGLALLGLMDAYYREVREERCPRDQLNNEVVGFASQTHLPG